MALNKWGGTGGREPGRNGAGSGRREGRKRESKGGGNREKLRNISQYFLIFCNRNLTKRRGPLGKGAGSGSRRYGKWEVKVPLSPPTNKLTYQKSIRDNSRWIWEDVFPVEVNS